MDFPNSLQGRDNENTEDVLTTSTYGPLALGLDDEKIAEIISSRISDSEAYWDTELDLKKKREQNEKVWLDSREYVTDLYDFQIEYRNNRIFTAIETLIPLVTSQILEPVVTEANDTDSSRELAGYVKNVLLAQYEDLYIKDKLAMVARHLLMGMRLGVMKYYWDGMIGRVKDDGSRSGGIAVEALRPTRVVIEQKTPLKKSEDVPLIGEYQAATIEELALKFPDKSDDIKRLFSATHDNQTPALSTQVGYIELWFSYFDSKGNKKEGVTWKYKELVLDKMKNPHYNYDEYSKDEEGNLVYNNFFDRPMKPYIFFNHLNAGRFLIDDTSLTEQALSQQDILYKRGHQIDVNADQANSGLIFDSDKIDEEDVAKLIGDPDEKVMVGGDVTRAASRLPRNELSEFVIRDKNDARQEIDNIFGTNAPLRGEQSGAKTLGQEIIAQRSNMSRTQTLVDSLETGGGKLYRGITQMMKVFWDEPTMVKYTGPDGYTAFMEFSNDKIEDGVAIRVKAGTLLPKDEVAERNETVQAISILDPLSIAEGLGKRNPKEFAKRIIYYNFSMDRYLEEILGVGPDSIDRDAVNDISLVSRGREIPIRENPTKEYLDTYASFLDSNIFQELSPDIKQRHIEFIKKTKDQVAIAIKQKAAVSGEAADASSATSPGGEAPAPIPDQPENPPIAPGGEQPAVPQEGLGARLQFLQPQL